MRDLDKGMLRIKVTAILSIFLGVAILALCLFLWLIDHASAHDIYTPLRSPAGASCCGGNDCEASEDFKINANGTLTIYSRRHNAYITVSPDIWRQLPLPANEDGVVYPAHWCGFKRSTASADPTQIDSTFHTYCAFVAPGPT